MYPVKILHERTPFVSERNGRSTGREDGGRKVVVTGKTPSRDGNTLASSPATQWGWRRWVERNRRGRVLCCVETSSPTMTRARSGPPPTSKVFGRMKSKKGIPLRRRVQDSVPLQTQFKVSRRSLSSGRYTGLSDRPVRLEKLPGE